MAVRKRTIKKGARSLETTRLVTVVFTGVIITAMMLAVITVYRYGGVANAIGIRSDHVRRSPEGNLFFQSKDSFAQIWALLRIKLLPVTHVLVNTWMLTVKPVYKPENVSDDLK